jgi:hypothetical protein
LKVVHPFGNLATPLLALGPMALRHRLTTVLPLSGDEEIENYGHYSNAVRG